MPRALALASLLGTSVLALAGGAEAQQRVADFRRVVVPDEPLGVQQAAAEELARYLAAISGQELAIIPAGAYDAAADGLSIFVGEPVARQVLGLELGPWAEEEWLLRTVPGGLLVAGQDEEGSAWSTSVAAGSMLAAYTLLDDHLGVRWFWPGPFGEHVPRDPEAVIPPLDVRARPAFCIRSISLGYSSYHTEQFREDARRWARRSRLGWTRSAVFGHSWYDAFNLRTDETLRAHPDWFALVDGVRRGPQMCTTHPEVIEHMVQYVLNGKADIMNISPSDGGGFCQCTEETKSEAHRAAGLPSCTALDVPGVLAYDGVTTQLSDRIFTYANEVARRVRERDPNKGCGMFAYTYYNRPPLRIEALEPNLYLSFVFQSAAHRDPEAYRDWQETVAGWQRLGARMVVREGWGNHYYLDLPTVHYDQVIANLAEAHRLGFIAAYGEGSKCFATQGPTTWAVVRMMWDPARDPAAVMDDLWTSAYGPVAEQMRAYFETYSSALDQNWSRRRRIVDTAIIAYANLINSWHLLLPAAVVDEAEQHLRAAEERVPPGEYAERVAFHRFGQDYTRMMLELLDCYRQLAELGVEMEFFSSAVETPREDPAARERLLRRALELGRAREQMLLAHRDWAAMDEGLYAFTNDGGLRQWHAAVKAALGVDEPTLLTRESLAGQ